MVQETGTGGVGGEKEWDQRVRLAPRSRVTHRGRAQEVHEKQWGERSFQRVSSGETRCGGCWVSFSDTFLWPLEGMYNKETDPEVE